MLRNVMGRKHAFGLERGSKHSSASAMPAKPLLPIHGFGGGKAVRNQWHCPNTLGLFNPNPSSEGEGV